MRSKILSAILFVAVLCGSAAAQIQIPPGTVIGPVTNNTGHVVVALIEALNADGEWEAVLVGGIPEGAQWWWIVDAPCGSLFRLSFHEISPDGTVYGPWEYEVVCNDG